MSVQHVIRLTHHTSPAPSMHHLIKLAHPDCSHHSLRGGCMHACVRACTIPQIERTTTRMQLLRRVRFADDDDGPAALPAAFPTRVQRRQVMSLCCTLSADTPVAPPTPRANACGGTPCVERLVDDTRQRSTSGYVICTNQDGCPGQARCRPTRPSQVRSAQARPVMVKQSRVRK